MPTLPRIHEWFEENRPRKLTIEVPTSAAMVRASVVEFVESSPFPVGPRDFIQSSYVRGASRTAAAAAFFKLNQSSVIQQVGYGRYVLKAVK